MARTISGAQFSSQRARKKKAERDVTDWNTSHPAGTAVHLLLDDGTKKDTVTRSEAWEVCGVAVILLEGVAGGYRLDRVTPMHGLPQKPNKLWP